jgi:hypothetical protein
MKEHCSGMSKRHCYRHTPPLTIPKVTSCDGEWTLETAIIDTANHRAPAVITFKVNTATFQAEKGVLEAIVETFKSAADSAT